MEKQEGWVVEGYSMDAVVRPFYLPHFFQFVGLGARQQLADSLKIGLVALEFLKYFGEVGVAFNDY